MMSTRSACANAIWLSPCTSDTSSTDRVMPSSMASSTSSSEPMPARTTTSTSMARPSVAAAARMLLRRRHPRDAQQGKTLVPREPRECIGTGGAVVLFADRHTKEDAIASDARHDVLEQAPRRLVRPLHVVDDDHEWTRRGGERKVLCDFLE